MHGPQEQDNVYPQDRVAEGVSDCFARRWCSLTGNFPYALLWLLFSLGQEGVSVFTERINFEVGIASRTKLMILMRFVERCTAKILCSAAARRVLLMSQERFRRNHPAGGPEDHLNDCGVQAGCSTRSEAGPQLRPLGPCPTAPA